MLIANRAQRVCSSGDRLSSYSYDRTIFTVPLHSCADQDLFDNCPEANKGPIRRLALCTELVQANRRIISAKRSSTTAALIRSRDAHYMLSFIGSRTVPQGVFYVLGRVTSHNGIWIHILRRLVNIS